MSLKGLGASLGECTSNKQIFLIEKIKNETNHIAISNNKKNIILKKS